MSSHRDANFTLIDDFEGAECFVRWLGERRPVLAIDTETTGYNWWTDRIRLIQFGDAEHGWAMRFDHWGGLVRDVLDRYDGQIAMHNFKFDSHFLEAADFEVPMNRVDDTRTMAHLIDPSRPTALKKVAKSIDSHAAAGQEMLSALFKNHNVDWDNVPIDHPAYWAYACLDTVLTARLWESMQHDLKPYRSLYDVEMTAQIALLRMEQKGAAIDLGYAIKQADNLRSWATDVREWAVETLTERMRDINPNLPDGYEFNIGSGNQVAQLMMADGWEPQEYTAKGQPKMTKEILESVDHDLARTVIQLKHAEKMASSYFDNFIELHDDGVLHCSINPLGAKTGRMSVTNPALQTLPRDALVRDAFIPRPGNRLVLIDYDQMEVRIMAHYAQEDGIRQACASGDIHTWTAQRIYGRENITKQERQLAKNSAYTIIYGGGAAKLAETAGVGLNAAKEFMQLYSRTFPGVGEFRRSLEEGAVKRGSYYDIRTRAGRLQRAEADKKYKLVNYLIQGTGADVLKMKIAELAMAGFGEYMILPVHDELVFDVPAEDAEDVMREAMEIMTDETFDPPLTVDGQIVDRWGEKYR